ncbi:MAG: hypothetical protein KDA61_05915 [Planctomycetales bacterium]|nr:hypothetical protein [Planctomycetales bacterium]
MDHQVHAFDRTFLLKWTLFTSGAFLLSLPLIVILPQLLPLPDWAGVLGGTTLIGAMVGYAQWLVMKKRVPLSGWWVFACAVGMGLPPVASSLASRFGAAVSLPEGAAGKSLSWTAVGVLGGLISGILQKPLLERHLPKTGWWIVASAAGWGLCMLAASLVDASVTLASSGFAGSSNTLVAILTGFTGFAGGLLFSVPLGVVTGVCLIWIANHSSQSPSPLATGGSLGRSNGSRAGDSLTAS